MNEKKAEEFVIKYFDHLKNIKQFRLNFKQFNSLLFPISPESKSTACVFQPLIRQVCEYLIKTNTDASFDQLNDIELRTTTEGIKDLFKLKLG